MNARRARNAATQAEEDHRRWMERRGSLYQWATLFTRLDTPGEGETSARGGHGARGGRGGHGGRGTHGGQGRQGRPGGPGPSGAPGGQGGRRLRSALQYL